MGPGTYEWVLRGIRLLGAAEFLLDFVGPKRLNRESVKLENLSQKVGNLRLSEGFLRLVKAYALWLWRLADAFVKESSPINRWFETYLDRRFPKSPFEKRKPGPFDEYGWKTNLLLLGVTLGVMLAVSHYLLPLVPRGERLSARTMLAQVEGHSWPIRMLFTVFVVGPMQGSVNGLIVLTLAGVIYALGRVLEGCLVFLLWSVSRGLYGVGWMLSYRRIRLAGRALAFLAIVLPELLPKCG
jgi:hypothetical protein